MKNKDTMVYIGNHSQIANKFAEEGYLVNTVSTSKPNFYTEHVKHDDEIVQVARDTLEGDATVIIMDSDFLNGIEIAKERIEQIIRARLKRVFSKEDSKEDTLPKDRLKEEVESILDNLPQSIETFVSIDQNEESVDKAIDNIFANSGNKYIQLVMNRLSKTAILGEEKHNLIISYVEQMKKAANERIASSRYESGEKRDLLEGNKRWKPMFILTSNKNLQDRTEAPEVSSEYLKMDIIKKILKEAGLELSIAGVVNTKTIRNGIAEVEPLKLIKAVKWAQFLSNSEERVKNVKDFMADAFEMFDILDVNGGIVGHSLRTAELMKCLLEAMNKKSLNVYAGDRVPKKLWKSYIIGALFHDNGKLLNISRPDLANFLPTLQTNASRLPAEGFDAVRGHAELGGDNITDLINNPNVIGNKSYLDVVATMAYYHQEFYMGEKGYSIDKKHDASIGEVPLEAQYMAIVDVFDAIIGRRNYNKQTNDKAEEKLPTMEQAMEIMAKQAGIIIKSKDNPEKECTQGKWCMSDKITFERKSGYFLDNSDAHFNQNLLMCFFELLQTEAIKFRKDKKSVFEFKEDKDGRLVIESIGGINFEQYLHRESVQVAKAYLEKPSKLGQHIQQGWKRNHGRILGECR